MLSVPVQKPPWASTLRRNSSRQTRYQDEKDTILSLCDGHRNTENNAGSAVAMPDRCVGGWIPARMGDPGLKNAEWRNRWEPKTRTGLRQRQAILRRQLGTKEQCRQTISPCSASSSGKQ